MSYQPTQNNEIPEPPNQMVMIITSDLKKFKILARFAPNIKRTITAYKRVERA
jgi:hypothetical protein